MTFQVAKWAVIGCALSMSAFAQGQMQQRADMGMPMPKDAKGFLTHLNAANEHEIAVARLAQEKATNTQVKQYAQMLVRHHTQLREQLAQAAQSQKIKLSKPDPVNELDKKMMDAQKTQLEILQGLEGQAFDLKYVNAMVGDHDHAIMLTSAALEKVQDQKLRQTLSQALPKFEQHRQTAYQLLGQLRPKAQPQVGGAGDAGVE
jgi:putative membrane protein